MNRDIEVLGVGMTKFAKHRDRTIEHLGGEAVLAAIADAGIAKTDIDEVICGSGYGGPMVGQRILREIGISGIPVTNVENACSSSASALRHAIGLIETGRAATVLIIGVDKLTKFGGGVLPLEQTDIEVGEGMIMPAVYAMRAQRYMSEFGATSADLAAVAVKAHTQGALNPYAFFRNTVTLDEVLASRRVADPLTLQMCCPTCDGAAAFIVSSNGASNTDRPRVKVLASALQSGFYKTGERRLAVSELSRRTSTLAYQEAGIEAADVDVAEVHDAFAIAELLYYEALGFCGEGEGKDLLAAGETLPTGRFPVNTTGGLLTRGHPVGPTGAAQICDVVWQLRGESGGMQVPDARIGLTQCTGGGIAGIDHGACTIHVLAVA